jgi:serine/threonine-protein kinase
MLGTIVEDRYLIEAELGAGAMGHVYRARHIKVGRQVAIKVMHAELAQHPLVVERFAREARIAARLAHPNVVSVVDVGVTSDARRLPLIVLELAPGRSLVEYALDPMPRHQVVELIRALLQGLDHAHAAGLVHRDLKPDNILVEATADGALFPRIVDFGIAVCNVDAGDDPIAGRRLTEANTIIGTPVYMSPEQAMAKPLDARSDLFSLGVIMYELLAGMTPFPGTGVDIAYANATKDAPAIAERAGVEVDPLLEVYLRKLMARRPDARFQSAREALAALDLIERDRMAATRVLAGQPLASAPAVPGRITVRAEASGVVRTPAEIAAAIDAALDAQAPLDSALAERDQVDRPTSETTVDRPRPARRRTALAGIVAAAALTAIVGWSAASRTRAGAPPAVSASVTGTAPTRSWVERPAPPAAPTTIARTTSVATVPPITPTPDSHVALQRRQGAKRTRAIAESAPIARPAVAAAQPDVAMQPVVAARETSAERSDEPTAADVAARYVEVGRKLRGAPDTLWARYRLIRINDAMATQASRKQVLATLTTIEQAVSASR